MKRKELSELTNEELLQEVKKTKRSNLYDAIIFGFLCGIAIYSVVLNGWGLITFIPLVYLPIIPKYRAKKRELEKLLKERNLK